jgi:hypothetical protein
LYFVRLLFGSYSYFVRIYSSFFLIFFVFIRFLYRFSAAGSPAPRRRWLAVRLLFYGFYSYFIRILFVFYSIFWAAATHQLPGGHFISYFIRILFYFLGAGSPAPKRCVKCATMCVKCVPLGVNSPTLALSGRVPFGSTSSTWLTPGGSGVPPPHRPPAPVVRDGPMYL